MSAPDTVSAERVITAPAQTIFDILADPAKHCVIDGSGTVEASRTQVRLALGQSFDNKVHPLASASATRRGRTCGHVRPPRPEPIRGIPTVPSFRV
jgi:hypothetical protein